MDEMDLAQMEGYETGVVLNNGHFLVAKAGNGDHPQVAIYIDDNRDPDNLIAVLTWQDEKDDGKGCFKTYFYSGKKGLMNTFEQPGDEYPAFDFEGDEDDE